MKVESYICDVCGSKDVDRLDIHFVPYNYTIKEGASCVDIADLCQRCALNYYRWFVFCVDFGTKERLAHSYDKFKALRAKL